MDKKQRILTVDDLYKCCVENDILHFSAEDSNKRLVVSTQGYFEAEEDDEIQETEGLMGLKVKISILEKIETSHLSRKKILKNI